MGWQQCFVLINQENRINVAGECDRFVADVGLLIRINIYLQ